MLSPCSTKVPGVNADQRVRFNAYVRPATVVAPRPPDEMPAALAKSAAGPLRRILRTIALAGESPGVGLLTEKGIVGR
jgi:hypothetical protein